MMFKYWCDVGSSVHPTGTIIPYAYTKLLDEQECLEQIKLSATNHARIISPTEEMTALHKLLWQI